jgi:hypothetical protein
MGGLVVCLLAVAVGRARRVGRGGKITGYYDPALPEVRGPLVFYEIHRDGKSVKIPVLIPGLADAQRILDRLKELELGLRELLRAEGLDRGFYNVKLELIPIELQMVLKEVAETVTTAILNKIHYVGSNEEPIGSLLATCDPRAFVVEITLKTKERDTSYRVFCSCKSHMHDDLELRIWLFSDEDMLGRYLSFRGYIHRA